MTTPDFLSALADRRGVQRFLPYPLPNTYWGDLTERFGSSPEAVITEPSAYADWLANEEAA